jgi:hypothetical protein
MNRPVEPTGGGHATFNPMRRLARWRTHDVTRRVYPRRVQKLHMEVRDLLSPQGAQFLLRMDFPP